MMPATNPDPFRDEPLPPQPAPAPASDDVTYEPASAAREPGAEPRRRRRIALPVVLFLLTCLSMFVAGATEWMPGEFLFGESWARGWMPLRRVIYSHWGDGLIYMLCLLAILLTHEMGHFVMTVVYRVRASLPIFLPLPISPVGTLGAVIVMDSRSANRREIFDIGIAGPIAGLVVALPIMWIGVQQLDFSVPQRGGLILDPPLAMRLAMDYLQVQGYDPAAGIAINQANPFFVACWVGLLVTGLNMLPVSQLDGGHVTFSLFGKRSHWVSRGFMIFVFAYMAYSSNYMWLPMAVLVLAIGVDHPPTSDDKIRLGWPRTALGLASLLIPIFCFVPQIRLS
jgi:membrane-associated protease RseP (regulator of RpoE activity)